MRHRRFPPRQRVGWDPWQQPAGLSEISYLPPAKDPIGTCFADSSPLDTHIWLWSVLWPKRLSGRVAKALADTWNDNWISPISTWEILILSAKGRVALKLNPRQWIAESMTRASFREAPLTHEVVMDMEGVATAHNDPADRFLVAIAKSFGLTLVTADENLIRGRGYSVLANR